MKRDMELARQIMLSVERDGQPSLAGMPDLPPATDDEVAYHIRLLIEAGLMQAIDVSDNIQENYNVISLTWHGHEFLETIRDTEVWSKTKAGASKVGNWSISLIADLGKAYVKEKAVKLGLPL